MAKDFGDVKFNADFGTGMVKCSVRSPLGINESVAEITIPDFLEIGAQILIDSVHQQRAMQAKLAAELMRQQRASGGKSPA